MPSPRKTTLSPDLPHENFHYFQRPLSIKERFTCSATMKTTWKEIPPVPTTQEFLDIVLSRTQRRLPTQIRSGFQISRIRNFYTRKVRYTQETFTEKLSLILGASAALGSRCIIDTNWGRGISPSPRHTPVPSRFIEHPLRV